MSSSSTSAKKRSGSTDEGAAAAATAAASSSSSSSSKKSKVGGLTLPSWFTPGRVRTLTTATTEPQPTGSSNSKCVLYWMARDQRVEDNWAMLLARHLAQQGEVPLVVCFNLTPPKADDPLATLRSYGWMVKGLQEVEAGLKAKQIPFYLLQGPPAETVPALAAQLHASAVVTDFSPLRGPLAQAKAVASGLDSARRPLFQVDAHNIVPVWEASPKLEVGARTIRKKIHDLFPTYFKPFPEGGLAANTHTLTSAAAPPPTPTDWSKVLNGLTIDRTVKEIEWMQPGTTAGWASVENFLETRLKIFAEQRNNPNEKAISHLSPYFNYGHLSVQAVMLRVKQVKRYHDSIAAFIEEGVVRRELSDNFCYYQPQYDSLQGAAGWAQESLRIHTTDQRQYLYTKPQLTAGQTHDKLWNASQLQLVQEGKLHGFLRMYWAKKILEWTDSPTSALAIALYLNDRFAIDGRDPNGFVGVGWSVMGVHDMGWTERKIFGKIRYMNYDGCRRKFDVDGFCAKYPASITAANAVQEALTPRGSGPVPVGKGGGGGGGGGEAEGKGKGKGKAKK